MKKTSIIIPCFNQLKYTKLCLESVLKYTDVPYELILIDNGSTDGTFDYLKALRAQNSRRDRKKSGLRFLRLIRNNRNLGYAKACNQGIKISRGDYILLLNNDTVVTEGWLRRMVGCAESDPKIGIAGTRRNKYPLIIKDDLQVNYGTHYKNLQQMRKYARNFAVLNAKNWFEVSVVYGFCMLIKRKVIKNVGLFDERFSIGNWEDDDYCLRAKQKGYKLMCCNDVFIHHFKRRSFLGNNIDFLEQHKKNYEIFIWKWGKKGLEYHKFCCFS